jgi:hypothetical protein
VFGEELRCNLSRLERKENFFLNLWSVGFSDLRFAICGFLVLKREVTWCRDYVSGCDHVAVGPQGVQGHNRHLR